MWGFVALVLVIIGLILLLALPSILFALPARIPSLRRRARRDPKVRRWLCVSAALLTFALDYALYTYIAVEEFVGFADLMNERDTGDDQALTQASVPEIWLEQMLPLRICYSGPDVCAKVDAYSDEVGGPMPRSGSNGPFILSAGTALMLPLSIITALYSVVLVRRFTRPQKPTLVPTAAA